MMKLGFKIWGPLILSWVPTMLEQQPLNIYIYFLYVVLLSCQHGYHLITNVIKTNFDIFISVLRVIYFNPIVLALKVESFLCQLSQLAQHIFCFASGMPLSEILTLAFSFLFNK